MFPPNDALTSENIPAKPRVRVDTVPRQQILERFSFIISSFLLYYKILFLFLQRFLKKGIKFAEERQLFLERVMKIVIILMMVFILHGFL